MVLVGLTAITIQFVRGQGPIEIKPFLITYSVILLPGIVFIAAISVALNVLLRNKYLVYMLSIGTGAGLFYLYSTGHNHWLYNPLLYQLWKYSDLTGAGNNQATVLIHRLYCLAIAGACVALAHVFFPRKSTKRFLVDGRLGGAGWSILVAVGSIAVAVIAGLMIGAKG